MSRVSLGTSGSYGDYLVQGYQDAPGDRQAASYEVLEKGQPIASGMTQQDAQRIAKALDYWQRMIP